MLECVLITEYPRANTGVKILAVHYSQSGQLSRVLEQFIAPLRDAAGVELVEEVLKPEPDYPFPWPFFQFFDTFPETVYQDAPSLAPFTFNPSEHYDLVILAYQVWFLSPSLPTTAFLQSKACAQLMAGGTPVITLIACRNMWLMAQEDCKTLIANNGGKLVGNVALVDEAGTAGSFIATPLWVLTGNPGPRLGGRIPRAGVSESDVANCRRFGERLAQWIAQGKPFDETVLQNLQAVSVDPALLASEKAGKRSFKAWGALFRAVGRQGSWQRKPVLVVYILFLLTLIVTVVPLSFVLKKLFAAKLAKRHAQQKSHYAWPSGEL